MRYDIQIGGYTLGMLDKVEIHRSVELLADTAVITLPAAQYNAALDVESKLHRGDASSPVLCDDTKRFWNFDNIGAALITISTASTFNHGFVQMTAPIAHGGPVLFTLYVSL